MIFSASTLSVRWQKNRI